MISLIRRIAQHLKATWAHKPVPRPNPRAALVMEIDYLARARARSRVRTACRANDLSDKDTQTLIQLFDARWDHSTQRRQTDTATWRETHVTQHCIDCAATWARQNAANVPDFLKV